MLTWYRLLSEKKVNDVGARGAERNAQAQTAENTILDIIVPFKDEIDTILI